MGAIPVIAGLNPDPSVCRVGEDYYLATSSFEYLPGVPIFTSRDLITWTQLGNVLTRPSQVRMEGSGPSGGIYAPTLRHHDGTFFLITTNLNEGAGQVIYTAQDPAGPWGDPVRVDAARGIDPDLAWDLDGTCYLTYCGWDFARGLSGIVQLEIDPRSGETRTEPKIIWGGTGGYAPEGPHLYFIDDRWYLLIAEGGTERGHCATIARSDSPDGPFVSCPGNPILTHRSTDNPVQNAGHADLTDTPSGEWALVHLGVRARGPSPKFHLIGRETFLAGVSWVDGWPMVEEDRYAIAEQPEDVVEEFTSEPLDASWVSPNRFPGDFAETVPVGGLVIRADVEPRMLCRRVRHLEWSARATLDSGDAVGRLVLQLDGNHRYCVEVSNHSVRAVARIGTIEQAFGPVEVDGDSVTLVVSASTTLIAPDVFGKPPDTIRLGVQRDDSIEILAELDGRYLSTEVAGGFTGRMIGIEAESGSIRVNRFRYQGFPEGSEGF
jgi:xylan 1,4-beta-xylosidase